MHCDQDFESHLFKSMRSYLCNQNRVQPVIGLSSVIELCTDTKPPVYLCDVCVLRVNKKDIKTHIIGSLHRYNYIKSCHTYEIGADIDLASHAWHLLELAKVIEKKEGTGNVQVFHLHEDLYKEMISQPVLDVLLEVNQQSSITELQLPLCRTVPKDDDGYYGILDQARSLSRTAVQVITPSPTGYPFPNCIPNISSIIAFSPGPVTGAFQRWNPISYSMQSVILHENKTVSPCGNGINIFKSFSPESSSSNTEPKYKRVAQYQNNSLTITIIQKSDPEHIEGQENIQNLFISPGAHTPADTRSEDQCQINGYLTGEELFRDTDGMLRYGNVGQDNWQYPQPFTADDTLFVQESTGENQQLWGHSEDHIVPLPKYSEESPENYSGIQPLIGLHAVIKCQSVTGDPPPCCYLCQSCSLKVLKSDIIHHLISPLHRINYINFQHPYLSQCHSAVQSLETTAMWLEQEKGRGQMEVRRLSACLFDEVLEQDFHWSMKMLSCGSTEERRRNQMALRKRSTVTPDYSIPLKQSAGITVDCSDNGASGKSLVSHKRAKKKVHIKKTRLSEPVFKVSLSLSDGTMLVDRIPSITATVAPEIE